MTDDDLVELSGDELLSIIGSKKDDEKVIKIVSDFLTKFEGIPIDHNNEDSIYEFLEKIEEYTERLAAFRMKEIMKAYPEMNKGRAYTKACIQAAKDFNLLAEQFETMKTR